MRAAPGRSRPTIHQIAARALAVVSFEVRVKAVMPFIVVHSVVSFLRRRVYTKKRGDRAAEQRDERATVAVGTPFTGRPPRRSVQAAFPHTALTSGHNGKCLPYAFQRL
jgi:hypothetical protein